MIDVEVFHHNEHAKSHFPSSEEIEEHESAIKNKYPSLKNCLMTIERLKLYLQEASNANIQG